MSKPFYTLSFESHRWFATRAQAVAALDDIVQATGANYTVGDVHEHAGEPDYRGQEMLAEQRNRLIDWRG